ncbi:hypothetical protein H696_00700 [Fonticula alba]|uniref:C3H1-type domain-containing protein n=1 Tax=Fonticula alba TaxID=691883 RepID=A0A058ZFM2_FONAL|nr:hypothetical protein H696_00700 [Fonticula alba]KCV73154.1 hypothetical protein H696_00700 [Fonticula alba]|eukprot:XP_009492855.1 hypothetical protein H696_00700 [Fonticula alba]
MILRKPPKAKRPLPAPTQATKRSHKKTLCTFFHRSGFCRFKDKCNFAHHLEQVRVCHRFLKYQCVFVSSPGSDLPARPDDPPICRFSHDLDPCRVPHCQKYLRGRCVDHGLGMYPLGIDDSLPVAPEPGPRPCRFVHLRVDPNAPTCPAFQNGFCAKGLHCDKLHTWDCPDWQKSNGRYCPNRDDCALLHSPAVLGRHGPDQPAAPTNTSAILAELVPPIDQPPANGGGDDFIRLSDCSDSDSLDSHSLTPSLSSSPLTSPTMGMGALRPLMSLQSRTSGRATDPKDTRSTPNPPPSEGDSAREILPPHSPPNPPPAKSPVLRPAQNLPSSPRLNPAGSSYDDQLISDRCVTAINRLYESLARAKADGTFSIFPKFTLQRPYNPQHLEGQEDKRN